MTGIYGNSAEDRHFESQLHSYLESQDDSKHDEFIEQAVEDYLQGEYFPFSPDHVSEALCEIHGGYLTILSAHLLTAATSKFPEHQANVSRVLVDAVVGYWTRQATAQAEFDWGNRE